jgi:hypothetical protein
VTGKGIPQGPISALLSVSTSNLFNKLNPQNLLPPGTPVRAFAPK